MAYNYLEKDNLKDMLHSSEEYMKDFFEPLAELERINRGKPGKVPKGKPRVTTGIMAGIRREKPKEVIQQLPSGLVIIRSDRDMEKLANATLTDIILPNANSGGTPYDKATSAIKDLYDNGSSWAYCFYNRRGDLFYADYRRKYVKDVLFEKGKVSEFDSNYLEMVDWLTEGDIKAIIWQQKQLEESAKKRGEKYENYDLKAWQELLDNGPAEKDEEYKSEAEKLNGSNDGYFKVVKFMQIGVDAQFYTYSPTIDKVLITETTKDPRGVMPLHGLIAEPDNANPLGEPLSAISASKVNLADFDMQMYQYGQAMGYSPTIKKWGETPVGRIKIAPDHVIEMLGTKQEGDDFDVVNINNAAISNYSNNAGFITTQIYNEQGGTSDSSIPAEAGGVGFSKAPAGIKSQDARNERSKGHLVKKYEQWQGRIFETLLNLHFGCSKGEKHLELEDETIKRLGLAEDPKIDFDKDYGKIKFATTAGTSQEEDNDKESEKLTALLGARAEYGVNPDEKFMRMYNQIVKNAGVAEPESLMYTDEEIEYAKQTDDIVKKKQMQELLAPPAPAAPATADPNAMPPVAVDPAATAIEGDPNAQVPIDPAQAQLPIEEAAAEPMVDPVAQDRDAAKAQLIQRGMTEVEAEAILERLEQAESQQAVAQ